MGRSECPLQVEEGSMFVRITLLLTLFLMLSGCGQRSSKPAEESKQDNKEAIPAMPAVAVQSPSVSHPPGYDRLHLRFKEATRKEPPPDARPPEKTMTGKSIGVLYEAVVREWDNVTFMKDDGSRIHYAATLETSQGTIEIELDDEHAPNHVRNFIALSKAGYYDGLQFDHILANETYEEIQAGSPLGAENPTKNSVGYWLNPEISSEVKHAPGSVGACHGKEKDTAGCKFYIALTSAEEYDGNYTLFGKVTKGLDVAEKIGRQPVFFDEEDSAGIARPLEPVVIRKVTIHPRD